MMNPFQGMLLQLILKTAGYRRSTPKRRSSRSRRWSRAAQTLFASWAVLGQLGGMGLLVGELVALPPEAAADPGNNSGGSNNGGGSDNATGKPVPNSWGGPTGHDTSAAFDSWGSMALGLSASAGHGSTNGSSIAIGSFTNASQLGSVAIGIGAISSRANQIVLGASTNINQSVTHGGQTRSFHTVKDKTTVTVPNLSGDNYAIVVANADGTLYRYEADSLVEAEAAADMTT